MFRALFLFLFVLVSVADARANWLAECRAFFAGKRQPAPWEIAAEKIQAQVSELRSSREQLITKLSSLFQNGSPESLLEAEKLRDRLSGIDHQIIALQAHRRELGFGYELVPMRTKYLLESNELARRRGVSASTRYLSPEEREQYRVVIGKDGLLRQADGRLLNTGPLPKGRVLGADDLEGIFVMGADGEIYVYFGPVFEDGKFFQHSSFFSGAPVASAGQLHVVNGKVMALSGSSGHYHPNSRQFRQVLRELHTKGVDLKGVVVRDR